MSIGLPRPAVDGNTARRTSSVSGASSGSCEPAPRRRRRRGCRSAGVGDDRHAVPLRGAAGGSSPPPHRRAPRACRGGSRRSGGTAHPTAASLDASAAVCDCAARCPACCGRSSRRGSASACDPPGDAGEPARVPERLQVEHDHVRLRVALPVLQQVVAGDIRLVPDADERRQPQARARLRSRRSPGPSRRSATTCRRDPAPRADARTSRSAARLVVLSSPRQFGPTIRMPLSRTVRTSASWRLRPSSPVSLKPAERTTTARTPSSAHCWTTSGTAGAGTRRSRDPPRRERRRARVGANRADGVRGRVHRIHRAGEVRLDEPVEDLPPTEPRERDAPITATVCGRKKGAASRRCEPARAPPGASGSPWSQRVEIVTCT
jgi:hypothetical protein